MLTHTIPVESMSFVTVEYTRGAIVTRGPFDERFPATSATSFVADVETHPDVAACTIGRVADWIASITRRPDGKGRDLLTIDGVKVQIDTSTGRVCWSSDWARVSDFARAGILRNEVYGPATYAHMESFYPGPAIR